MTVLLLLGGCGGGGGSSAPPLVVNSLLDAATPPAGMTTLRSALAEAAPGQPITFDAALDGGTIALSIVANEHTILKGEVMGIRNEPSGPVSYLIGYFDRDYGRSALEARKDVVIDASSLPRGVTIAWTGGSEPGARVLAVDGDLTLTKVSITGGSSVAEAAHGHDAISPALDAGPRWLRWLSGVRPGSGIARFTTTTSAVISKRRAIAAHSVAQSMQTSWRCRTASSAATRCWAAVLQAVASIPSAAPGTPGPYRRSTGRPSAATGSAACSPTGPVCTRTVAASATGIRCS